MFRRSNLIGFRHQKGLTQTQMAKLLGVGLSTYNFIEKGKQDGKLKFWDALKEYFNLTGEEICELQKKEQLTQGF